MNIPRELREESQSAAMKWRVKQNPDVARRISRREEDAFALGYQAGVLAWEAKIAKLDKVMNPR